MKKNKIMRFASILMVLTILSTCAISGTFAKYVTSATAEDTARVAKWGVQIATWDTDDTAKATSLFKANYDDSVIAGNATDLLVAPGTKNDATINFSITGQPEVTTKLDFVFNVTSDVVVPAGSYLDWTTGNDTTDEFTVAADYYPVVFTLAGNGLADGAVSGNLEDIKAAFEALSTTVEPNTDLAAQFGTYTLTWAWDFDDNGAGTNDAADTLLGNNAAGIADDAGVSTELKYDISIKATQVD